MFRKSCVAFIFSYWDANSGTSTLQITGNDDLGQHLSVSAGQNVLLKAFGKVSNTGGASVGLSFFDANWHLLGANITAQISSDQYQP